jgi:hypothetical protein
MRTILLATFALTLAACATAPHESEDFKAAFSLWEKSVTKAGYDTYNTAFVDAQNKQAIDDKSGCYSKDLGRRISMIAYVDARGVISNAYSDDKSDKAKCFEAAYVGKQMPVPPFSPLPVKLVFN